MSDKTFGKSGSVYVSSFAKQGQGHTSSAKNRAECQRHTNDLNTTHFQFGTDTNGYHTETRFSFKNKSEVPAGQKESGFINLSSQKALENHKSSLFRNDDPNHPYYQRSTHFVLGTNTDDTSSLYYKDFMLGKRDCLNKPLPAPPPISSKVLPNLEDCLPLCSTNTADFVDHRTRIQGIGQGRAAETKLNRERHNTLAVAITCDARGHAGDRQASMTGADYLRPPRHLPFLSPQKAPRSKYRYLDSDGALLRTPVWPMPSETKEFIPHIEDLKIGDTSAKYKEKKADCQGRIQDNRKTHFQFGSDDEIKHSEQHDQFLSSIQLDPSLPAAGKSEGPERKYSHIYPSESAEQGRHSISSSPSLDKVAMIKKHVQQLNQQRYFNPRDPMNVNLRKAFLEFDTSLSGRISKEDLRNVLSKLAINMDMETFEKLLEMCDKDHSGCVDYQEFAKHLTKDLLLSREAKPLSSSSVMKTDYCPPEHRRFTSAQQRTIEMSKRIVPLSVSSHYFHKHQSGAPRLSATSQDFVRPDRMSGIPRLFAR